MVSADALAELGWALLPHDPALLAWAQAAREVALGRAQDPDEQEKWLRCEGTWFVGVDCLPNDARGDFGAGPLPDVTRAALDALYGALPLHPAQVSILYPGYPRPRDGEGEAAFRYRARRDAAHVDGLLPVGEARQRMLRERHAYIAGIPLTACDEGASPLSLWEGSHRVMHRAFSKVLADMPEGEWATNDLTEAYTTARREVFETCKRITLTVPPGEAYVIHRHTLHGVAPWTQGADAPPEGRMIAYFRPEFPGGTRDWLDSP